MPWFFESSRDDHVAIADVPKEEQRDQRSEDVRDAGGDAEQEEGQRLLLELALHALVTALKSREIGIMIVKDGSDSWKSGSQVVQ